MKNSYKLFLTGSLLSACVLVTGLFQNCADPSHIVSINESSEGDLNQDHWDKADVKTSYTPNLADRFYIMSILKDVFGPSAETVDASTSTGSQLYNRLNDFGTPCSFYEDYRILNNGRLVRAHNDRPCIYGERSDWINANIISTATVSRQGYMINTCTAMVENATTLKAALTKINGATYSGAAPAMTRQKLATLYANFYRGRPEPSVGIVDSLQLIFQYQTDPVKAWKAAIYSICVSSEWQVL
jgi:hypothetical protein